MNPVDAVFWWGFSAGVALSIATAGTAFVSWCIWRLLTGPVEPFYGEQHDGRP